MITTLPFTTAEIVNTVLPRNITAKGIVERKIATDAYIIALPSGKIAVQVPSGELSEGDSVSLTRSGSEILIERLEARPSSLPATPTDTVSVQSPPQSAALKSLADAAVEQLRKQVLDKDTLDLLQKILAAVAKDPRRFGIDTVKAVEQLKAIVAAMPRDGTGRSEAAHELAARIIELGGRLAEKLKGDGVVDVVLRAGAQAREGYYRFDNVKSAISWLSENKEIPENIPWQKVARIYGSGPVVIKVYESAIGDMRASFVAPDKTTEDLAHFAASTLRADVWKNVSGPQVLQNILSDRREIPLARLLEIDRLLVESQQQTAETPSASSAASTVSKGYEAALGQWLAVALDNDVPVEQLIPRVPAQSAQQIPLLLATIDAPQETAGIAIAKSLEANDFAVGQETFRSEQPAQTMLPDLFRRLGLNLESALSKSNDTAPAEISPRNLKVLLLSLLSAIDAAAVRETVQAVQPAVSEVRIKLDQAFKSFTDAVQSMNKLIAQAADRAAAPGGPSDAVMQLVDKVRSLRDMPAAVEGLVRELTKSAAGGTEELVRIYREAARRLVHVYATQPLKATSVDAGNTSTGTVAAVASAQLADQEGRAANALQNIHAEISDMVRKLAADVAARVETLATKTFVPSTAPQQPDQAVNPDAVLVEVKQRIMSFINELPAVLTAMVRQSTADIQAAQKELAGLIQQNSLPVLSQVVRNAEATLQALDMMMAKSTDSSTTAALAQTKQALEAVFSEITKALQSAKETVPTLAQDATPIASAKPAAAQTGAAFSAALPAAESISLQTPAAEIASRLDNLTTALKDSQTRLVQQTVSNLDEYVGTLSEQIERLPTASVRRDALPSALESFSATITNKVAALVREASAQVSQYAKESAQVLESGTRQLSRTASPDAAGPNDILRNTGDQTASRVSAQLAKTAQGLSDALQALDLKQGQATGRAADMVRTLQQFVARAADEIISSLSGGRGETPQSPSGPAASQTQAQPDPQQAQSARQVENLANEAGRQIMAKVKDLTGQLQELGRRVSQLEDRLPKDEAGARLPGGTKQAELLANNLRDALKLLDSMARNVSDRASTVSHDVAKRLDDLSAQTAKLADRLSQDTAAPARHGPLDSLKQQVENALTRVESLQVLARSVNVADGSAQVISLPMKIEGQWTDVVVKFVKKQGREGKNRSDRPVSVAIHVSPALLGDIDVFMDYGGKKRFSMRMEFEKQSTRAWFEKNRQDFSAAIAAIGFAALKIDMKETGPRRQAALPKNAGTAAPAGNGTGTIDITA
jgi:hypothetical protein